MNETRGDGFDRFVGLVLDNDRPPVLARERDDGVPVHVALSGGNVATVATKFLGVNRTDA